ncbi:3-oxoacyl-ACP synthase [Moraxella bovoculi]|uniref:3-oxoacyl-[acyl-carrier-protein] synthase 2 n=2 Tax=Moraxella TaxID=475 RepID=A0AAC8PU19_9GAMM|nr:MULTISPECIES: beta-ketoacyl-ACP synthase II [Moraxella]AKG06863.1 3-oxoacyl-ACP synthase [Moraxella bovoculi]AKG08852.1 3-oxoacyl-ACP synthase [Moraxella bovoculi]AKG12722.1 3-oxoacyl-ACP synthase [Moraxella bovoculi]ANB90670.1 3-oxoacyl-ACP synthase [Moraxella ovis]SPX80785.1 3-oxoacyl-[acyl-carrier-protein] synthase 2 [Moraxella ovis]
MTQKPIHHQRPDHERVVITGMGAITPVGNDLATIWENLTNGKSGITKIESFGNDIDVAEFRSQIAGLVKDFDAKNYLNPKEVRRYDEFIHYAQVAAAQALHHAGLIDDIKGDSLPINIDGERFGVVMGSGIGGIGTIESSRDTLKAHGAKKVSPFIIPGAIVNMPAGLIAIRHGLKGANLATATACTTSTHAIGLGARLIAYGDLDAVLVGGSEKASTPLGMSGFGAMHALSTRNDEPTRASRPFDTDRDGFVLGDGAGALVLESLAHAKARGATILAELVGFGMSDDASHITAPPEDGEGARRAIQNALRDAGLDADQVGYVNAHGTSTPAGDVAESCAIQSLFGDDILVSSTKSMTGHLLGAAGAIEAIFTVLALQNQTLPPTINLDNPDERCTLDYIAHTARKVDNVNYAISNSFGFGGTNGSLVFGRWQD